MITKKLLEFQKLGVSVERDGMNPHFRSSFTTLNEVFRKVKKPLNDLGIMITQCPEADGLRTLLIDIEDDTRLESFVPFVGAIDMQKLGGAITYAKRYALIAMLGLEDEDDDAESAVNKTTVKIAAGNGEPFSGKSIRDDEF